MARKNATQKIIRNETPSLELTPGTVFEGDAVTLRGAGWDDCLVSVEADGEPATVLRVSQGRWSGRQLRPDASGQFTIQIWTAGFEAGRHRIAVISAERARRRRTSSRTLEVLVRPLPAGADEDVELAYQRNRFNFQKRFGRLGHLPEGIRQLQVEGIRNLHARHRKGMPPIIGPAPGEGNVPSNPMPGACNWVPVGAGPVLVGGAVAYSGRTLCVAIDPTSPNTLYIGTAHGGVWKSADGGQTWAPKSDYQTSLAIGALAIDPNNNLRVFAGTGEYAGAVGTYYGSGVLRSVDGGNTWTETAKTTFPNDAISRILFDPTDATSQTMYLSSTRGVYESTDGGSNWNQLRAGSASDLVLLQPSGPPGTLQLIAGFDGSGLWTTARKGHGAWSSWTQISSAAFPTGFHRIALGQCQGNPQTLYAAFSSGGGIAGMAKSTDGGSIWTLVTPPLYTDIIARSTPATADNHTHLVTIPNADLNAPAAHVYTTAVAGSPPHTHTITLSLAEMQTLGTGTGLIVKTTDPDATGHQHTFYLDRRRSGQTWYNFHITVHPTDPNTVYYGEVYLWKTTTGDGPWTALPILHTDQHGFAFDPSNSNHVWMVCDGGVYDSANAGGAWQHRNRDLGTLQYISVSQHPTSDAVMIGGTQDNGTHRYTGDPGWAFSDGGDGGFTAIDPGTPTRMYHEYVYSTFYRSDSAGDPGTWVQKGGSISGASGFYSPFELDPSNPSVCYFGGDRLWRSPDHSDTWAAITAGGALNGIVCAIAVHPADSNTVYIGTDRGSVYRVQRTGATWNLSDVTTTNLTAANLPANVSIGSLAVDPAGTVWATVASVLFAENTNEYSSDHVFRLTSGSTTWETRSGGLVPGNPVNAIVIDPSNSSRLFCGADVSVFRTEDAGVTWTPWDEGLPTVPIFDLAIYAPLRLLRAATHGRSIWERPIDSSTCPMVDLYLRDYILDTGRVQPTLAYQPDPLDPAQLVSWWESVDVKVDTMEGTPPAFQTASPIGDYVSFEAALVHRNPQRGTSNRFYVQVHNRGINPATNVQVRAFFADASLGLPNLPSDFWSAGKPFLGTPSGADWTPIGSTKSIGQLPAAEPGVLEWDWAVPTTAADHSCLLVVATCVEDPLSAAGIFDVASVVKGRKQVTLKNLHVVDPPAGQPMQAASAIIVQMNNPFREQRPFDVVFHWQSLPQDTRVFVALEKLPDGKPAVLLSPVALKRLGIDVARGKGELFPPKIPGRCGAVRRLDLSRIYQLRPGKARSTVLPSVRTPAGASLTLAINLIVPKDVKRDSVQFSVAQLAGQFVVGGSTYLLRLRQPSPKEKMEG
jgi:photosystem II stability/assembly factor-like uncharacterized protein